MKFKTQDDLKKEAQISYLNSLKKNKSRKIISAFLASYEAIERMVLLPFAFFLTIGIYYTLYYMNAEKEFYSYFFNFTFCIFLSCIIYFLYCTIPTRYNPVALLAKRFLNKHIKNKALLTYLIENVYSCKDDEEGLKSRGLVKYIIGRPGSRTKYLILWLILVTLTAYYIMVTIGPVGI